MSKATVLTAQPVDWYEALDHWQESKRQLDYWKAEENRLRVALAVSVFPKPKEGVNKTKLRDGRDFVVSHKINRTVDSKKLGAIAQSLAAMGSNYRVEDFFKARHDLYLSKYNEAPLEVRKLLDTAITLKPGTPNVEVKDAVEPD